MSDAARNAQPHAGLLAGSGLWVEWAPAALEEIVRAALEGFLAFPFGGVEVGGVLFGTWEGDLVRILASRPLACEHAAGPGFTLSESDQAALRELLDSYAADEELAGLVPVGCYHSHTRGPLALSPADVELHNCYFPEPWQVAMLLQPRQAVPTRVGFFVRGADGTMPEAPNYLFEVAPVALAPRRETLAPAEPVSPSPAPEESPTLVEEPAPAIAPPLPDWQYEPPPRRRWIWLVLAALLALIGGGLAIPRFWPRAPATAALALRLVEKDGRLEVRWDPSAPGLRRAQRGWLEITDGPAQVVFPLDVGLLRAGSWPVVRQSAEVRVRMTVQVAGAPPIEESAHFLGPPAQPDTATVAPTTPSSPEAVQQQVAKLRAELEAQLAESSRLERWLKALEAESRSAPSPAKPPVQAAPPRRAQRVFAPPSAARRPAVEVPSPPALAEQQGLPLVVPAQTARPLEAVPAPPPPAPKPSPPAAAPAEPAKSSSAYRGPASGRLFWTGLLPKNSTLTIENGRPSQGHLTGELPGVPVHVGASPAEFTGGGLTVYSASPRFVRGPVTEPPGAHNGWNRTTYRYDLRLARELVVVEAPSAANGWSRLVLRSGERPLSVILLEWELIP